jgi:alpha-amylase
MQAYCRGRFGVHPEGLWLAERVWDPSLPALLAPCGVRYTLVDDTHLRCAGLLAPTLQGYYLTERAGHALALFPIDKGLRYRIPFFPVDDVLAYLRGFGPEVALTYGDDGEKFGLWPDTYDWVVTGGWLDAFFARLEATPEIATMTPGAYLRAHAPAGRAYVPTAAYQEMLDWTLSPGVAAAVEAGRRALAAAPDAAGAEALLRGGLWENFLVKYPESNQMQKRMLLVSERLAALEDGGRLDVASRERARRALYRAQCNCAYWHGLFGGLYLNWLRHAVFQNLLEAEAILDAAVPPVPPAVACRDYDCDGYEEVVIRTPHLAVFVKPAAGGAIAELDYLPARFNLLNTLARREEAYHHAPPAPHPDAQGAVVTIHERARAMPADLAGALAYDRSPRYAFCDHVWNEGTTLERLVRGEPTDVTDLAGGRYAVVGHEADAEGAAVRLSHEDAASGLCIEKTYRVDGTGARVAVAYALTNRGPAPLHPWFALEINLSPLAGDAPDRCYAARASGGPLALGDARLASRGEEGDVVEVRLVDRAFGFEAVLVPSLPVGWWRMPVETVSQSEEGYERMFQGSALFFHRRLALAPGATVPFGCTLEVRQLTA